MSFRRIAVLFALIVSGCATAPPQGGTREPPIVMLVSIDAFRADYLSRGLTPTLSTLAAAGASGPMQPSFPTKTVPNHYTIVTGLRPDHHGVVNNTMRDPTLPGLTFRLQDKSAVLDRRWWDDGEPIWVTAQNAGLIAASVMWPGSEADVRGVHTSLSVPYDKNRTSDQRIDQALTWLDLPAAQRPRFVSVYLERVDNVGHAVGPDDPALNAELVAIDGSIERLVEGLETRGLRDKVVVLVVSDHGLAGIAPDQVVRLGPVTSSDAASVLYNGATVSIEPAPGREAEVAAEVLAPRDHMQCWRRGTLPDRFAFGHHRRVPTFFCLADVGWEVLAAGDPVSANRGDHGYDNVAPEMQAIFIANGPGVRRGATIRGLKNVDVHALLGRLLGLTVPADDGDPLATADVLAR